MYVATLLVRPVCCVFLVRLYVGKAHVLCLRGSRTRSRARSRCLEGSRIIARIRSLEGSRILFCNTNSKKYECIKTTRK